MNSPIQRAPRSGGGATKAGLGKAKAAARGGSGRSAGALLSASGQGGKASNKTYAAAQAALESND